MIMIAANFIFPVILGSIIMSYISEHPLLLSLMCVNSFRRSVTSGLLPSLLLIIIWLVIGLVEADNLIGLSEPRCQIPAFPLLAAFKSYIILICIECCTKCCNLTSSLLYIYFYRGNIFLKLSIEYRKFIINI